MRTFEFKTNYKTLLADILTPVSLYLKLRDKYPKSILLESSDYHGVENSFSYLCLEPVATFTAEDKNIVKRYPGGEVETLPVLQKNDTISELGKFISSIKTEQNSNLVNGFFGYTSYNSIQYFEKIKLNTLLPSEEKVPEMVYSFYRFIISINHFKNELVILENQQNGEESRIDEIIQFIKIGKLASYPFIKEGDEETGISPQKYMEMVKQGKYHCRRGDVFQIVLSRSFSQKFKGDEFNVYRALRNINPSPYLFYFDFGSFKLFGSSPEAQITVKKGTASINPIAGTVMRTGNDIADMELAEKLTKDPKENAEHVMLVDLARNDLSRNATDVHVEIFREVQYYSHVIHLVSKVSGKIASETRTIQLLADTFPAGTLSGAPKHRAMELIDEIEGKSRGYYGGCIGYLGLNGEVNHAILIRSFLSKNNNLIYRAGAGIVEKSKEEDELKEVDNKVGALRAAIEQAQNI
ncbi:MAG: anthranilate synthase component I family protein [Bacteroidales bacterium]